MRDEDKPFVLYRYGRGGFRIAPRNARGWRITILWALLLVPIMGLFAWFTSGNSPSPVNVMVGTGAFLAAMLVWTIAGIRWMKARAEVVDLEELLKLKREADRNRRR